MAPATSTLFAGIPPDHLPGLAGGAAALLLVRLRPKSLRATLDALGWLLVFTGGVHIGLTFGHASGQPLLSLLFLVNGVAYMALVLLARDNGWWRPATGVLLFGTIL